MRRFQTAVLAVMLLVFAGAGAAQTTTTVAVKLPAAEPILGHIPAGAMGYVVVNNVKGAADKAEAFLNDIGVGQMLGLGAGPEGRQGPGLVGMLQGAAMLGDGFNPNAGFAVVLLDPEQFGVDVLQLMGVAPAAPPGEGQVEPKVPFVILVPGKGVQEVFGAYEQTPAGKYIQVALRMGPMLAAQAGGYVLLSPRADALDALIGTAGKAAKELSKVQAELLAKSDIGMHLNMKIAGPIYMKLLDQMKGMMAMQADPEAGKIMGVYVDIYRQLLADMDSVTAGGRFADKGIVLEEVVAFLPESCSGKATAAYDGDGKASLASLPSLPYVLAFGSLNRNNPEMIKMTSDMMDEILASESLANVPEETRAKLKQIVLGLNDQITDAQFVGGGAPEGSGLFGLGLVYKCKDSAKVESMIGELAGVIETMLKSLVDDPDVQLLNVAYAKAASEAGGVSVGEISIRHPELDEELDEDKRAEMVKVLGEDKLSIYLAPVNDKTLAITFGGSKAFLAEVIKTAAAGNGTILAGEGTLQSLSVMPAKPAVLGLLNIGNLFDVIAAGQKVMDPEGQPMPFRIATKTPIAFGMDVVGSAMRMVVYVPNDLVREVTQGFMMMFMVQQPQTVQPAPSN